MQRSGAVAAALLLAACATPPDAITARQAMTVERGFAASLDDVALCLVQELNTVWPQVGHRPRIVVPRQSYRIVSAPEGTLHGALAVIEVAQVGNRGARAVISTAHQDDGAQVYMERAMRAAAACDVRFGGPVTPDPPTAPDMWSGYTVPDQ